MRSPPTSPIATLALAAAVSGSMACVDGQRAAGVAGAPAAATSDWSPPADPTSMQPEAGVVRPGTSCDGLGTQVTDRSMGERFSRDGDIVSRVESWACGCPSGPVFVMLYGPGTSPLELRLCADPSLDTCEGMCRRELRWDLAAALAESGAREVVFVDP